MGQTWRHLLFAHWPIDAQLLRPLVPAALPIDEFDGTAWLGVTPFMIESLRIRGTMPLPIVNRFPELNVRTYTTIDGRPGVHFLRLDTPSTLAILAARSAFRLPYEHASIELTTDQDAGSTHVRAEREDGTIELEYEPVGPAVEPRAGTLEYFLTERYRLYTVDDEGRPAWAEIHHRPWPLQQASARIEVTGYLPGGLEVDGDAITHVSERQDVVIWPLESDAGQAA